MGTDIRALIAIDDNSPFDQPPFTNDPSYWDLSNDIGLSAGKHYGFYAAIAGIRNETGREPLFPPRGLPKHHPSDPVADLVDYFNISWLTLDEIYTALMHMDVDRASLSNPVSLVLDAMADAERRYGRGRVRLIFGFS